ncbi:hypothetical protein AVEN_272842-1 [Araneus ventricosus]|uniref:Uncharacterized protein n=1 Tax=Araneus ventricosus TaxID=182803 RepID=A0A4Y2JSW3_ARAVE|nr:hypothetical protein AVEN_272842-1 [Araneus ventricosus]
MPVLNRSCEKGYSFTEGLTGCQRRHRINDKMRVSLLESVEEARKEIATLQEQVSSVGSCPIVNCAVHISNVTRPNSKRSLSGWEDVPNLINDDPDLNNFKFLLKCY